MNSINVFHELHTGSVTRARGIAPGGPVMDGHVVSTQHRCVRRLDRLPPARLEVCRGWPLWHEATETGPSHGTSGRELRESSGAGRRAVRQTVGLTQAQWTLTVDVHARKQTRACPARARACVWWKRVAG